MSEVPELVDHLFRRQSGRMVSTLTAILGSKHIQLAEDVVQEALVRALQLWPFQGVPDNPRAWLIQVARNQALDRLRRDQNLASKAPEIERRMTPRDSPDTDDQLAMMFLCCHPRLPDYARVCLTLKTVSGFSVAEIARALLAREDAVAQRIVRAKRQIREEGIAIRMPPPTELPERLESVLQVLYLVFNEGYSATQGPHLIRRELCDEAIYLGGLLASDPVTAAPQVHALLALMLFQAARFEARMDESGELLLLPDQDRSRWDRRMIAAAFRQLDRSAAGEEVTEYHLQAAIAAEHASAPGLDQTNWTHIVQLYDQLSLRNPSPVILLNRAVAIGHLAGPAAGLAALAGIPAEPLAGYYLFHATRAFLHASNGDKESAAEHYRKALACNCNDAERAFLDRRLLELA
ncbi:MAG: sigma-70 family RNA polymerase sigma factor [Bryobacterales bacterium]|nr:sigma-70 family RNA polymerase sigma factor [Bryobacterales bacterium]